MLDPRHVADRLDEVRAALVRRNPAWAAQLEPVAELVQKRRQAILESETKAAARNAASNAMAKADKSSPEFAARREELKTLSNEVKALEKTLGELEADLEQRLLGIPNTPDPSIPDGEGAEGNQVVRTWGQPREYDFTPKPHWEVGEALGLLDFERAAKLSGARFTVLFGAAARLERALVSFMLDLHTREHGYTEVLPPFLVKDTALHGHRPAPQVRRTISSRPYKADPERGYDLYLIPTAEVPVTNLHAQEILEGDKLRCPTRRTRRASAPRPGATAVTSAGSSASTSSTRSSW
jgi:seryl-tRNA synthetase